MHTYSLVFISVYDTVVGDGSVEVLGLSGLVGVSSVYGDTLTQWLGKVGFPQIVRDGLGILGGVRGYSDTVVGEG